MKRTGLIIGFAVVSATIVLAGVANMLPPIIGTLSLSAGGVPSTIHHQGVVSVSGTRFTGMGYFKFAIVNAAGTNVWTNDNTKKNEIGEPDSGVAVNVIDGVYSVSLGGSSPSMTAISPGIFTESNLALRIWFRHTSEAPWQQLSPDHALSSVPYAFSAAMSGPPGLVQGYAGASAPAGWLLCDGSQVSRTTYAALYAVTGDTYGAGDGSTTFNLPDLRGRVPMGADGSADRLPSNDALGNAAGQAAVNLAHTHPTGNCTLTVNQIPAHSHQQRFNSNQTATGGGWNVGGMSSSGGDSAGLAQQFTVSVGGGQAHNHGDTSSGLSSTQSVLNPYQVINYIIKY